MQDFRLQPRHFEYGLTADDFTAYAGYPVNHYCLGRFPYWDEVRDGSITTEQLKERAGKIYCQLQEDGLTVDRRGILTLEDTHNLAGKDSSFVSGSYSPIICDSKLIRELIGTPAARLYFETIRTQGLYTTAGFPISIAGGRRNLVIPFWEGKKETLDVLQVAISSSVFTIPFASCPRDYWATSTLLPNSAVENLQTDDLHVLFDILHERAHLRQLRITSSAAVFRYYDELAADLEANSALRAANKGDQTITLRRHQRYIGMLFHNPEYWFAPAADAFEAGRRPPSFYRVRDAFYEIQLRLTQAAFDLPPIVEGSKPLQAIARYALKDSKTCDSSEPKVSLVALHKRCYDLRILPGLVKRETPVAIYSLLRQLAESEVFTDRLTRRIAARIVQAAEAFNPDLTRATNPKALLQTSPS